MRRKLVTTKGVTLVEMLACVLILILLGLMFHTGLEMAAKSYHDITVESEIQLLLSTITDALADDLRYAREIVTEEGEEEREEGKKMLYYNSDSYGLAVEPKIDEKGQIMMGEKNLLPSGVYGNGAYEVKTMGIYYDGSCFTINLEIGEKGGTISAKTRMIVRCLNGNFSRESNGDSQTEETGP